jgi:hypothetical protein
MSAVLKDKIITILIEILQKQSNRIRTLALFNVALGDLLRQTRERMGVPLGEFPMALEKSLASAESSGPEFVPDGIDNEINEILTNLEYRRESSQVTASMRPGISPGVRNQFRLREHMREELHSVLRHIAHNAHRQQQSNEL